MHVDVVGGSIAGLTTAIACKHTNPSVDVTVYEKYKTIGFNHEGRRCGEAHSVESEWAKWKPNGESVFNEIFHVETIIGEKSYVVDRRPGTSCILNRQAFISQLAAQAKELGVHIVTGTLVKHPHDLDAEVIVDASGCPSSMKKALGIKPGIIGKTFQHTIEECNWYEAKSVKIIFTGEFGYIWVFPRNADKHEVNLGIGVIGDFECNLKELLEEFKQEQHITGTVNYVLGGPIPLGLQRPLKKDNLLFVGDAGVGSFPLTGQGIYRALISGEVAGRCIGKHQIDRYPAIINQKFLKWDIWGKTMVYLNNLLRCVGPKAVFLSLNWFLGMRGGIH